MAGLAVSPAAARGLHRQHARRTPSGADADPRALTVQATDTACSLSAAEAPSGNLTFSVTNGGAR